MDLKSVLDQFLVATGANGSSESPSHGRTFASGAATGGLLGLLVGSKSGRKFLSNAAAYGGIAVVGGLAYNALKNWQASKRGELPTAGAAPKGAIDYAATPQEFTIAPKPAQLEFALISAMIAAAHADGRLDAAEQRRVFEALEKSSLSSEERSRIFTSFESAPSVEQLASMVDSMEHKAELYIASCIGSERGDPKLSSYLERLAKALRLPNELTVQLRDQAMAA